MTQLFHTQFLISDFVLTLTSFILTIHQLDRFKACHKVFDWQQYNGKLVMQAMYHIKTQHDWHPARDIKPLVSAIHSA